MAWSKWNNEKGEVNVCDIKTVPFAQVFIEKLLSLVSEQNVIQLKFLWVAKKINRHQMDSEAEGDKSYGDIDTINRIGLKF